MTEKTQSVQNSKITSEDKVWAAVGYIWILSLLALAARKNNEYIRFHASQGVFLFLCSLFAWVPFLGWIIGVITAVLAIFGIIKALQGQKWELPVVGKTPSKFADWIINTLKL